jgi:hypothetical protein
MKRQIQQLGPKEKDMESPFTVNVGGRLFLTSLSTLTLTFPESECACTFTNLDSLAKDANGYYFIDADPDIFKHILNVLRYPSIQEEQPPEIKKEIWKAALDHWVLIPSCKESQLYKKRRLMEIKRSTPFDGAILEQLCAFIDYDDIWSNVESHSETILEGFFKTHDDLDLVEFVKTYQSYVTNLFNVAFSEHDIFFQFGKLDSLGEDVIEELTEKYKDIKKDANTMWIVFIQC